MAAIILSAARTSVRRLLDDNGQNKRYPDAQIDEALQAAVTSCLSDYCSNGGDAFETVVALTTSAAGLATLPAVPLLVRTVTLVQGFSSYELTPALRGSTRLASNTVRDLSVEVVLDYQIPTNPAHPLVGVAAVAGPTWASFDQWVCSVAALTCGIMDNDRRPGLEKLEARLRMSAMVKDNTPTGMPLPDSRIDMYADAWQPLSYIITGAAIQIVTTDSAWL